MIRNAIAAALLPMFVALTICLAPGSVTGAAEPGPDEGLVVFSRKNVMKGKAIRFNIEQDGRAIGQLLAGSTIEVPLTPGSYGFSVRAPSLDGQDYINIDVEAGWTYYVEGEILWGWPAGRPKFRMVSETPGASQAQSSAPASTGVLAGVALGSVATGSAATGAQAGRSAEERGRIGLRNFAGDWDLEMWSLAADGSKLTGKGVANGAAAGDEAMQIVITEFEAAAFPEATGGGQVLISYVPDRGFTLESNFRYSDEVLRFSGQYMPETGRYVFHLFGGSEGETATGIARSSVRVEIRSLDIGSWVADTYSSVDGQSLHVQSYSFTRR